MLSWYFFADVSIFNENNVYFYFSTLLRKKKRKQVKLIGKLLRFVSSL